MMKDKYNKIERYNENCTTHVGQHLIRGHLYRVIQPDVLTIIVVNFKYSALVECFGKDIDESIHPDLKGEYRLRTPTIYIEPDTFVKGIPFYYLIGGIVDSSSLFSMDMFEWYEGEK